MVYGHLMTCCKHLILLNLKVLELLCYSECDLIFKYYFSTSISCKFSNLPNSLVLACMISGVLEIVVKDIESRDLCLEILFDCVM